MAEEARPRILVVTRNLPPLVGGMERLNWNMLEQLSRWAEVRAVAPAGAAERAPAGVVVHDVAGTRVSAFLLRASWRAVAVARAWRPDIVLAGSGLTAPLVWLAARSSGAVPVAYVHGLDIVVPHAVYRYLWLPAIRSMGRVLANSRATAAQASDAGVAPQRLAIVHPGVKLLPEGLDGTRDADSFRHAHGLGDRPLLLSVGRLTARKGLLEFVQEALPAIAAARPDVMLLVVGDVASDALYGHGHTADALSNAACAAGVGDNVRIVGRVSEVDLRAAYLASDVHVFPVRDIPGDPEGFGMVAVEAAAHALPTAAYATGGVVEAVCDGQSGRLVPPGDAPALANAVLELLDAAPAPGVIQQHALRFGWDAFGVSLQQELKMCLPSRPSLDP